MRGVFQTCVIVGVCIAFIAGVALLFLGQPLQRHLLHSQFVLSPESGLRDSWTQSPEPISQEFYFFNWTNSDDIYNGTIKPRFQEVGPYRYHQVFKKENVVWNSNGTVTFQQNKFWYFREGSLSDEINLVNPMALVTAHTARSWGYFARKAMSLSISAVASSISIKRNVSQLLFEGYPDPILQIASAIPLISKDLQGMDRFGLLYKKNGSASFNGVFNIGTGDKTHFAQLYTWNYKNKTEFYDGQCGRIDDCLGDFFGFNVTKTKIKFFTADLCRSITLEFVGETKVNDILGYKFALGEYALDNGTKYPETKCFCPGECLPSGIFNVSGCRAGAPFFVSLPHFHRADPYYINQFDGLNPDQDKHEFSIVLEPTTGIPLQVDAKLQVNFLLQSVPNIRLYQDIPNKYLMPLMWYQYRIQIPQDKTAQLKLLINMPQITTFVGIGLIVSSIIIALITAQRLYWRRKSKRRELKILQEQKEPFTNKTCNSR